MLKDFCGRCLVEVQRPRSSIEIFVLRLRTPRRPRDLCRPLANPPCGPALAFWGRCAAVLSLSSIRSTSSQKEALILVKQICLHFPGKELLRDEAQELS